MSAAVTLQDAIFDALVADAGVTALVGDRVYDNAPAAPVYPYISFGPAQTLTEPLECLDAEENHFQIDIWTQEGGSKRGAKAICAAVKSALHFADLSLAGPCALVLIRVDDMQVMDDPDDQVAHGVVSVVAFTEDNDG
ncbi:DUF3168 domain-containing protein [Martelella alba]|uniref:DUF3168 domain-containing protein n=1 Tax=Martelella alba TaxID=2590451 RepID=A0A506U571_9HYPH|nr:DUF3168 domain-containing protein [Martelella alba]TPW28608.1 DUF3168 domain-containing protein [Martelella alba]